MNEKGGAEVVLVLDVGEILLPGAASGFTGGAEYSKEANSLNPLSKCSSSKICGEDEPEAEAEAVEVLLAAFFGGGHEAKRTRGITRSTISFGACFAHSVGKMASTNALTIAFRGFKLRMRCRA